MFVVDDSADAEVEGQVFDDDKEEEIEELFIPSAIALDKFRLEIKFILADDLVKRDVF